MLGRLPEGAIRDPLVNSDHRAAAPRARRVEGACQPPPHVLRGGTRLRVRAEIRGLPDATCADPIQGPLRVPRDVGECAEAFKPEVLPVLSESCGELLVADSQGSPSLCRTVVEVSVPCQRAVQVAHFVASSEGWRQDRHGCQSQLADCRRPSESVPFQPSMICCTSYLPNSVPRVRVRAVRIVSATTVANRYRRYLLDPGLSVNATTRS